MHRGGGKLEELTLLVPAHPLILLSVHPQVDKVVTIISNPLQYKVPNWFLNRQKDIIDGKYWQLTSSNLDSKLRDDLERLKKIRSHRGLRHYWGLRVRGQHTKTTGRRGRTVGVSKKK